MVEPMSILQLLSQRHPLQQTMPLNGQISTDMQAALSSPGCTSGSKANLCTEWAPAVREVCGSTCVWKKQYMNIDRVNTKEDG